MAIVSAAVGSLGSSGSAVEALVELSVVEAEVELVVEVLLAVVLAGVNVSADVADEEVKSADLSSLVEEVEGWSASSS